MANRAAIATYGELPDRPVCYAVTHGRDEPCDGNEHPCPLQIIKETKLPATVEHTHFDQEGKPRFFEIHAYPLFDPQGNVAKIIEYSFEITRQKQVENELEASEIRFREFIESAHDMIQSVKPDGSFAFVNRAWHETLGYSSDDLTSITLFDIIHPDSIKHCMELFSLIMTGQNMTNLETTFMTKDGRPVFVEGNISPRLLDGQVIATHAIFRDITERKRAAQELARYSAHLEQIIAALNVAQEVQQSLLPKHPPQEKCFELAGSSLYCDETGGDYYDYFELSSLGPDVYGVVVDDVSGHGISSALLMASVRAYLRGRITKPGSVAEIITEVNRMVAADTMATGQFMTLFFLMIEARKSRLTWVRAGHDPALVYSPDTDNFEELGGRGLALGVNEEWRYDDYAVDVMPGQIVVLPTDGIWEAQNKQGEMFGKNRFKEVIRRNADLETDALRMAIIDSVTAFRGEAPQEDDITLVVSKFL